MRTRVGSGARSTSASAFPRPLSPSIARMRRPWLIAVASFAAVVAVAVPVALLTDPPSVFAPNLDGLDAHPGVQAAVPLASGGLQAMDAEGDTIWVMTTLQNLLQEVSAQSGDIEATYPIDARVEGVVVGGGRLWLTSPDNGGSGASLRPRGRRRRSDHPNRGSCPGGPTGSGTAFGSARFRVK